MTWRPPNIDRVATVPGTCVFNISKLLSPRSYGAWVASTTAALMLLGLRTRLFTVTVRGHSMEPTFLDGDRLLACRVPCCMIGPAAIVVAAAPPWRGKPPRGARSATGAAPTDWVVKRVHLKSPASSASLAALPQFTSQLAAPARHSLYLLGDGHQSIDSRNWGPFPCYAIVGVVILRYASSRLPVTKAED